MPPFISNAISLFKLALQKMHIVSKVPFPFKEIRLYPFPKISNSAKIKEPTFTFAHIVCPHEPFVFDEHGNNPKEQTKTTKKYANQLSFINKKTMKLIDNILDNYKNTLSPIIVIQGDHGGRCAFSFLQDKRHLEEAHDNAIKDYLNILSAYYLPDGGNKILYKGISPVNTFRVIFDYYFNANLGLLEDKNYFYGYPNMHHFRDVTKRLATLNDY